MKIKHSLPTIQAKLRRLNAKAMKFAVWADLNDEGMAFPVVVGFTTKGYRVGRRYDRIAEKYSVI